MYWKFQQITEGKSSLDSLSIIMYYVYLFISLRFNFRWLKVNKSTLSELTYKDSEIIEGNEYEYRISAENKVGVGPPSSPTKPILAKDPWGE